MFRIVTSLAIRGCKVLKQTAKADSLGLDLQARAKRPTKPRTTHLTSSTRTGLVAQKTGLRYRFDMLRAAAGVSVRGHGGEGWQGGEESQSDVLRHSYASYWLAIHKNRAELAEHMGNSAKIIRKHYRRVMPLAEAEAWFAILPPVHIEAKILRMD